MPPRYLTTAKLAKQTIKQSTKYASKAAIGLARWARTDHTGTSKILTDMAPFEFRDKLAMVLIQLLATLLGIAGSVAMVLFLFMVVLPWLFGI